MVTSAGYERSVMTTSKEEWLRTAEQQHREAVARLGHTVSYSSAGLQAMLLANGGALIGLFTLIAPHRDLAAKLWPSGLAFSIGMMLTLLAWLFTAAAQDRLQIVCSILATNAEANAYGREPEDDEKRDMKIGGTCVGLAYVSALLGIFVFLAGCLLTLKALA